MKKKLWLIPVIALPILALAIGLLVFNSSPGDFEYREIVGGIAISRYTGNSRDVVIPAKVKGQPVTMIDRLAFDGVGSTGEAANCRNITSVVIPESVTVIGDYAFRNCNQITTLIVPKSVTSIGEGAFSSCERLSSIIIPGSVTEMGDNPFFGCGRLKSITVDEENSAFTSRDGVLYSKDMTILLAYPAGRQDAGLTIPDGVTRIGKSAFSHCKTLTSVSIPDSVRSIGPQAFLYCTNLSSVLISDGLTGIENWTFEGCSSLASVELPQSVTYIGEAAFCDTGLTSVSIPDGVISIEERTFLGCKDLTAITIPNSVEGIGDRAFKNCGSLSDVYYAGTQAEWYAISMGIENGPLGKADIHTK